jgi:hypothetical protein
MTGSIAFNIQLFLAFLALSAPAYPIPAPLPSANIAALPRSKSRMPGEAFG